jgi:crotonobetainyl-CoA:carnitine CoA-transferase CaiB-like acyl-CoA transferase
MTTDSTLPLSRYTVLDLTIARAGPSAVRLLADWGARVIRIEPPPGDNSDGRSITGDRHGPDDQNLHRNKRSLTIDLKNAHGRALFGELVGSADVVVENFRAAVKQRLSIDYESLKRENPKIILASISGFGQTGPYSPRAGVDQIVQGLSGLMSVTGHPGGGPVRAGIAISDTAAGMFLGQGILLALLHREHTGVGQWVHTSMLESMLSKMDFQAARYTMLGETPEQQGNDHPTLVPMGTFEARDGPVRASCWMIPASLEAPIVSPTRPSLKSRSTRLPRRFRWKTWCSCSRPSACRVDRYVTLPKRLQTRKCNIYA